MIAIETQTIAALSTPPGAGGIAIIRLSGAQAHAIVSRIFHPWPAKPDFFHLYLGYIFDPVSNQDLDQVLFTLMPAGHSYSGEDMAEIHCHGGLYNSKKILSLLFNLGAQPAPPGEFTKRAYLNGHLDLTQAEAVSALISAESEAGLAAATAQLAGGLADVIRAMLEQVNRILAAVEVEIDLLAEEGLNYNSQQGLSASLLSLEKECRALIDSYARGRILRSGIKVVLAGRPNVGKSSIMNALLAEERALVSTISGTTRDVVSAGLEIGGVKVELSDTAGLVDNLRPDNPQAELEVLGMARTEAWLKQAALILLVLDQSHDLTAFEAELYQKISDKPHLLLLNKQDKKPAFTTTELRRHFAYEGPVLGCIGARDRVKIDAVVAGIDDFIKSQTLINSESAVMITQQRHYDLLSAVASGLAQALALIASGAPPLDMLADELHQVRLQLLEIIGADTLNSESLLDVVFSQFCVGK